MTDQSADLTAIRASIERIERASNRGSGLVAFLGATGLRRPVILSPDPHLTPYSLAPGESTIPLPALDPIDDVPTP